MSASCLCIGGTLDGLTIAYRGEYFRTAKREPEPVLSIALAEVPTHVAFPTETYRAEPFRCGSTRWNIYIIEDMPTEEAFARLLTNYKKDAA